MKRRKKEAQKSAELMKNIVVGIAISAVQIVEAIVILKLYCMVHFLGARSERAKN
jgi:ABC-type nickel/cobalt efflux system permease component RcnA